LASRFYQCAVHVKDGQVEELVGLLLPNAWADLVEDVLQSVDVRFGEPAAEVTRRRWVRDAVRPERIEEVDVVAPQFDIIEMAALAQGVVSDIEDVVGLMIGQMDLEQMEAIIDGIDQSELQDEGMHGADAAVNDAVGSAGDLVVNVASGKNWLVALGEYGLVEASFNTALAGGEFLL